MKISSIILSLIASLILINNVFAVYYDSGYIEFSQPNGVKFTGREWGDEFIFQRETQNGYSYIKENDGWYYFALLNNDGKYIASNNKVGVDQPPAESYKLQPSNSYLLQIDEHRQSFEEKVKQQLLWFLNQQEQAHNNGQVIDLKIGILLVEFKDVKHFGTGSHTTYSPEHFDKMFFSQKTNPNYNWYEPDSASRSPHPDHHLIYGSMRDYYWDVSRGGADSVGALRITGTLINPTEINYFGVIEPVWLELDSNKNYYQQRNMWEQAHQKEGIYKAKKLGWLQGDTLNPYSFPQYDKICVIYAQETQWGGGLHPNTQITGFYGKGWWTAGERYSDAFWHIGVHAHEMGHLIGMPDEYRRSNLNIGLNDRFDLMNTASWCGPLNYGECPSLINPYYRIDVYNWAHAINVTEDTVSLSIEYNYNLPNYYKVVSAVDPQLSFYLENRRRDGFDMYTPNAPSDTVYQGGWLLIWKVDLRSYDCDRIDFVHADGNPNYYYNRDFFPSSAYGLPAPPQNFNSVTIPSTFIHNRASHIAINNIRKDPLQSTKMLLDINRFENITRISGNATWSQNQNLNQHVFIDSGAVLNINPGVKIQFPKIAGDSLSIHVMKGGALNSNGTQSNPIEFGSIGGKSDWRGFVIYSGGNLNLSWTTIKNSALGIDASQTSFTNKAIEGLSFIDCKRAFAFGGQNSINFSKLRISATDFAILSNGLYNIQSGHFFKSNITSYNNTNFTNCIIDSSSISIYSNLSNLSGCTFINSSQLILGSSSSYILNNTFLSNSRIDIEGEGTSVIKNNLFNGLVGDRNSACTAISLYCIGSSSPSTQIINNTIAHYAYAISCSPEDYYPTPNIRNNILYGNTKTAIDVNSFKGDGSATYNNIYDFDTTFFPYGNGNFYADPLFRDTLTGDCHLAYNSPCIDAGDPNDLFSNEPEPNGGRINMGHHGNTAEATGTFGLVVTENLQDDAEWDGQIMIANDVSTNGYDLTVNAGARVYFENGKSLTVNGKFSSIGSLEHPIIYRAWRETDKMNGVILTGEANADLRHSEFRYGNTALTLDEYVKPVNQEFSNLTFDRNITGVFMSKADAVFRNSYFSNNHTGMLCQKSNLILSGSYLNNNTEEGLYLFDEPVFEISGNQFNGNGKRGVYFNIASDGRFDSNTVYGNATESILEPNLKSGIVFYQSTPLLRYNQITENLAPGILSMSSSAPIMIKSANNLIANNRESLQQNDPDILAKDFSFPFILGGHNDILDDEGGYLIYGNEDFREIALNVSENYWGTTDENDIAARLYRWGGFIFTPFDKSPNWEGGGLDDELLLFSRASDFENVSNFTSAYQAYDSILFLYPTSHTSKAALQRSVVCRVKSGQNGTQVRAYLAPMIVNADEHMSKIARRLTYRAYTNESDYDQAIQFHDQWRNTTADANDSIYSSVDILTNELLRTGGRIAKNSGASGVLRKTSQVKQYKKDSDRILAGSFYRIANDRNNDLPKTFALSQNYPNPFNPSTTIKYQLPFDSKVTVKIYNILGQEVATLVNKNQTAGYYTLNWNGKNSRSSQVTSGVYIYRIVAKSAEKTFVKSKKMMLIK